MNYSFLMAVMDSCDCLAEELPGDVLREATSSPHIGKEVASRTELHDKD
jgi:hypothetical protein